MYDQIAPIVARIDLRESVADYVLHFITSFLETQDLLLKFNPNAPRFYGFKMTQFDLSYHEKYYSDEAKFYIIRVGEEHCKCQSIYK